MRLDEIESIQSGYHWERRYGDSEMALVEFDARLLSRRFPKTAFYVLEIIDRFICTHPSELVKSSIKAKFLNGERL